MSFSKSATKQFIARLSLALKRAIRCTKRVKKQRLLSFLSWKSGLFFFLVVGVFFAVVVTRQNQPEIFPTISFLSQVEEQKVVATTSPVASPFPFQEMTIPYLQSREYSSTMGAQEKVSETSTYTTYLTSYDSDGFQIHALLTIPKGQMPAGGWPTIIFIHGYIPPMVYQTQSRYADYIDFLSRNGFVVLKIDLRGHGKSEGEADGAYYSEGYVVDTLNAYDALQTLPFVNAERVGLWGHSMAGNVVFRSMVVEPELTTGVIWAGAVYTYEDLQEHGLQDNSYRPPTNNTQRQRRREQLFSTHGQFDPNSDFWQQVVPTNYLENFTGAIQFHHAQNDEVVDIEYSRGLAEILYEKNIPHELYEYASGGHNLTGSSFGQAMNRTVNFFRANL